VASLLVLTLIQTFQRRLIEPMVPVLHDLVRLLAPEFTLTSEDIVYVGNSEVVRVRANLSAPIEYEGQYLYPLGWNGLRQGWFQVELTLGGVLQYSTAMLIGVLAWPVRNAKELAIRLTLLIPLAMILIAIDTPLSLIAELWNIIREEINTPGVSGWMVWARFLQGGGGFMLAALFGALCIAAAGRASNGPVRRRHRNSGYACLVTTSQENAVSKSVPATRRLPS
jgi:hypothetical protein